jgi:Phosphorylase superfamily
VVLSGIALTRARADEFGDCVITCGVAGGLRPDLPTGAIVIPESVAVPGAQPTACDKFLSESLVAAALQLGYTPFRGALLTSASLICGQARSVWARAGFVAADMETGFIRAPRIAAVRVILDTPQRELSDVWLQPASVIFRPDLWLQGLWLARTAPRCTRVAAEIVAAAFA